MPCIFVVVLEEFFTGNDVFDIRTALVAMQLGYWMVLRQGGHTLNEVFRPLVLSQIKCLPSKKNAKKIVIIIASGTGDGRRKMRISKTNHSGLKFGNNW